MVTILCSLSFLFLFVLFVFVRVIFSCYLVYVFSACVFVVGVRVSSFSLCSLTGRVRVPVLYRGVVTAWLRVVSG